MIKKNKDEDNYYIRGLGRGSDTVLSALLFIISFISILPVILIIIVSFSSEDSVVANGYSFFPDKWSLEAYSYLSGNIKTIMMSFGVTAAVTLAGTFLSLFFISTMAYALSQKDFHFNRIFTYVVMIPVFFGGGVAASYAVNTQMLGMKNTIFALILPPACSSWYIIVMRTYFLNNIPPEILEAARLDGASTFRIFRKFVLPLSKPILITVGLFEAFSYWNIWYENLLYTDSNHSRLYTLQYVLYNMQKNASFISSNDSITGAVVTRVPTESFRMALVVVIILPILVTYPLFQRYFKKGLLSGSGK